MKIEKYRDDNDEYRWRIVAANGNIMADSAEGYKNKADRDSALIAIINSIRYAYPTVVEVD